MAFWIACSMKAIKEQIDEQPKIIKTCFQLIMQEIIIITTPSSHNNKNNNKNHDISKRIRTTKLIK